MSIWNCVLEHMVSMTVKIMLQWKNTVPALKLRTGLLRTRFNERMALVCFKQCTMVKHVSLVRKM